MKSQVYDRFGGGLLLLVMLTIAIIAGETQTDFDEPVPVEDVLESDAGFQITIDEGRLSVPETVQDLPIRIEESIEETKSPVTDIADSSDASVQ